MQFSKQVLLEIEKSYSVNLCPVSSGTGILIGSEIEGPNYLLEGADFDATPLNEGPGGTMIMLPVPELAGHYVSVMGMFPPFIGQTGGVYYHTPVSSGNSWETRKVFTLPFAHRIEILPTAHGPYLIAASVAKDKDGIEDWDHPGQVFAAPLTPDIQESDFELIIDAITRNHGMITAKLYGEDTVCVSGKEGIFSIALDSEKSWRIEEVYDQEVSEMIFYDLDGDGIDELTTIEPFHGNRLRIYRQVEGSWQQIFEDELAFGHGLWVGEFNGVPTVFVGNRLESKDLVAYRLVDKATDSFAKFTVEADTGTTQTAVYELEGESVLIASNPVKSEIALYREIRRND